MRTARLVAALGLICAPALASAQERHPFTDSWFWGAKGGVSFLRTEIAQAQAPSFGLEWLITRSRFALYLSADQSYFDAVSTVSNAPSNGVVRLVDIADMRRVTGAAYFYPKSYRDGTIRPYAGIGYSFNFIVLAASQGNQFASPEARDTVLQRIEDARTRASLIGTVGVQFHSHRLAPFIQATILPTRGKNKDFLINGEGFSYLIEAGLRYNIGTAIEAMR